MKDKNKSKLEILSHSTNIILTCFLIILIIYLLFNYLIFETDKKAELILSL